MRPYSTRHDYFGRAMQVNRREIGRNGVRPDRFCSRVSAMPRREIQKLPPLARIFPAPTSPNP